MQIDRAVIEIQGGCNYTCQMCPQTNPDGTTGARGKNWMKKMPLAEFERYVAECAEHGLNVVNLDGSGEATVLPNLPEYISIVKKYNAKAVIFSNGMRMFGSFMEECVDAGLDFFRFSIIGYDYDTYRKWMNSKHFYRVISNLHEMKRYVVKKKLDCVVATYHLILDNNNIDYAYIETRKNGTAIMDTMFDFRDDRDGRKFALNSHIVQDFNGSSDYIEILPEYLLEIPERYGVNIDIMIEAKMKELSIEKLYEKYPQCNCLNVEQALDEHDTDQQENPIQSNKD